MSDVHESAGAVVLLDGRALVAGGHHVDGTKRLVDAVELYDPAADRWTATATMLEQREGIGTLLLLNDGRVLLPGEHYPMTGSELFDPATERWTATGALSVGRGGHISALLDDGRVLVAGGIDWLAPTTPTFDSAELYDPVSGSWRLTAAMGKRRMGAAVVKLADGRAWVLGGYDDASAVRLFRNAEIYDPASATWSTTSEASRDLGNAGVARLTDGRVLVAGGVTKSPGTKDVAHAEAEIYDPATDRWTRTGSMATARSQFPLLLLGDGRVLAVGGVARPQGWALAEVEIYDPVTERWSSAGRLGQARWNHRVLRVSTGVLVVGGYSSSGQLSSVELNDRF
jgi:N-acetylneuraminic acid mutarotase